MRRIYFFLPDYPSWSTGGHKYHTILFEYFKSKRSEVFSFGHNRFTKLIENNKFFKIIGGICYALKIPRKSVVIQSNTSFLHFFIPVLLNKFWKHHYYFLIVHHLVRDEKPSFTRKVLEDFFIKRADKVVTISKTTRKKLSAIDERFGSIKIICPGLDANIQSEDYQKTFPGINRFLYVGSIEERKGLEYLIDALKLLNIGEFEINIIGKLPENSNEYFNDLKKRIHNAGLDKKVIFRGRVNSDELKEFYVNSTAFIFPSLWEGYGMVITESMAYGLPVIASRIPAIEELIVDGKDGLMFEPADPKEIAVKIEEFCNDKTLQQNISKNSLKRVRTLKTWDEVSEEYYQIINVLQQ
ncbi:MAG: glycosyltransferase family 4 protein [Ignavibacteria bacterium]